MIAIDRSAEQTSIRLDSKYSTWLLASRGGVPELTLIGPRLSASADPGEDGLSAAVALRKLPAWLARPVQQAALDDPEPLTLLPEAGAGFLGSPGLQVHRDGADFISQLRLADVTADNHRVTIRCVEPIAQFTVDLVLDIDPLSDVMQLHSRITNEGQTPLTVEWLAAACIALPANHDEAQLSDGRWCYEYGSDRYEIRGATLLKENRHGRTSHKSFPVLLTGTRGADDVSGELLAAHLGWSGNHRLLVERTRDGRPFAQLGELLAPGEMVLGAGEQYQTPTVFVTRSATGRNQLMQNFHSFVRRHILRPEQQQSPRPVNFNTWEACYFEQTEALMLTFIEQAADMGAERFVIDDGWFVGRNSDQAGLGDWTVDTEKYPRGLEPIIDAVQAAGMQFGLWIEPEMINADSDLYRAHPEWVLGDPNRQQPLGRNQMLLDITRAEVFDHLLATVVELIKRYKPSYVKWDMNRDLTHVIANKLPASHRMTSAAYRLLSEVRRQCPSTEIEICSSGGARSDYGALAFGDRIWTSDNHDPADRQRLHYGFGLLFPPEVMGSHVGGSPTDTTGRRHGIGFRVATALAGHFGIELTKTPPTEHERDCIRRGADYYKQNRDWLHQGQCYYLPQRDSSLIVRLQVAADQSKALAIAAQIDSPSDGIPLPIRMTGLDPATQYQVKIIDPESFATHREATLSGEILMNAGLQPPVLRPDSAVLVELSG